MAQIVSPYYAPDIDNAWSVAPGALSAMDGFAPLQAGTYGSMGQTSLFNLTSGGIDTLHGQMFRQINGSVRFLTFRPGNIDEFDNTGARTNRGTSYNASTTNWSADSWGNQIIACNYLDATQSSTSTSFSALSGAPKARYVASNLQFVMLADVDDGGSNVFSDMVWWGGLQDPSTWTPSIATQAGNQRLLDVPGPIKGIIAFRDTFVVFKENAIFVGAYVGPPPYGYIFQWRLVSARIGCIAPKSIVELDGKLYFMHSSGIYEFDGQALRNIGLPIFQSFMALTGYAGAPPPNTTSLSQSLVQAVGDDIDGVVWFHIGYTFAGTFFTVLYGYNTRAGKWGRFITSPGASATQSCLVMDANYADHQAFKTDNTGRLLVLFAPSGGPSALYSVRYPAAGSGTPSYTTGIFGSVDGSDLIDTHYIRTLAGTTSDTGITGTTSGYSSENQLVTNGATTSVYNAEFDEMDCRIESRFKKQLVTWTTGKVVVLGGIGFNGTKGGKR